MTTLQKIKRLTWWNEIAKLKDILTDLLASSGGISEAPIDGIQYGRQDGNWTEITGGGGSQDLDQTLAIGNTTNQIIHFDDENPIPTKLDIGSNGISLQNYIESREGFINGSQIKFTGPNGELSTLNSDYLNMRGINLELNMAPDSFFIANVTTNKQLITLGSNNTNDKGQITFFNKEGGDVAGNIISINPSSTGDSNLLLPNITTGQTKTLATTDDITLQNAANNNNSINTIKFTSTSSGFSTLEANGLTTATDGSGIVLPRQVDGDGIQTLVTETSLTEALSNKLDKNSDVTSTPQLYAVRANGTQTMYNIYSLITDSVNGIPHSKAVYDFVNSRTVENTTTTALTSANLNTAYPTATLGFEVIAASITGGGLVYKKTSTGWVSYPIIIVV